MTFKFAIRDDDPNYFTDPGELERAYADLPESIPISFAVVPFHGCTKTPAIPEERWEGEREFPIDENEDVVAYLRKGINDGSFSIMLHGYNHVKYRGRPEFVAGDNLRKRIRKGLDYLEGLFDTEIDIFVPPNNSFSERGMTAVKEAGLRTFYYPTPLNRATSLDIWKVFLRDLFFKYRHKEGGVVKFLRDADRFWRKNCRALFMPVRPWPYSVRGGDEFTCVSMTRGDPIEPIKRQMEIANRYDAKFCLAVHYHAFRSDSFSKNFYELIEYARSELDPQFVGVEELFD